MKKPSVYILAPAGFVSGGPEALHQLRYYLELLGADAWIMYFGLEGGGKEGIPACYLKYFPREKKALNEKQYENKKTNLVIVPETRTRMLWKFMGSKKAIWWLSVGQYDGLPINPMSRAWEKRDGSLAFVDTGRLVLHSWRRRYLDIVCRESVSHYCASKYAFEYVTSKLECPAKYLVEPLGLDFIEAYRNHSRILKSGSNRERGVLYNPSKSSKLMQLLLERRNFDYIPLRGYSTFELINLFQTSRLYVDFGSFPGPERIPKEAVLNGCNILVRRNGAASNDLDVAIPEKYKLKKNCSAKDAEHRIRVMLDNYDNDYHDFDYFRERIEGLESDFKASISRCFAEYL